MGFRFLSIHADMFPYERLSKILPYTDTFLYDLKCMDDDLHKKYTGVSNEKILDNLARLSRTEQGSM